VRDFAESRAEDGSVSPAVPPIGYALPRHVAMTNPRIERVLAGSRLFSKLDPPTLSAVLAASSLRTLARGESLWNAGEPATHFTIVVSGLVKVVQTLPDGTEAIVGLFGPRESVGDAAVVGRDRYPAAARVASEQAEVVRVDAAPVLTRMETRADLAKAINRALLDHTHALQEKIRVMSAGAVPKRLATLLLTLGERFGDEHEGGELVIPLAISRGELACLIGARVETTIRCIRGWEKAGVVETTDDGFVVKDVEALRAATRAADSG
jgi:CRP-like cAMP-binding protein